MLLRLPVGGDDGRGVSVVLTRQLLEELSAPLFKRMGKAVDEACWQVSPPHVAPPSCRSTSDVFCSSVAMWMMSNIWSSFVRWHLDMLEC